jgi:hypothetical protein
MKISPRKRKTRLQSLRKINQRRRRKRKSKSTPSLKRRRKKISQRRKKRKMKKPRKMLPKDSILMRWLKPRTKLMI